MFSLYLINSLSSCTKCLWVFVDSRPLYPFKRKTSKKTIFWVFFLWCSLSVFTLGRYHSHRWRGSSLSKEQRRLQFDRAVRWLGGNIGNHYGSDCSSTCNTRTHPCRHLHIQGIRVFTESPHFKPTLRVWSGVDLSYSVLSPKISKKEQPNHVDT